MEEVSCSQEQGHLPFAEGKYCAGDGRPIEDLFRMPRYVRHYLKNAADSIKPDQQSIEYRSFRRKMSCYKDAFLEEFVRIPETNELKAVGLI